MKLFTGNWLALSLLGAMFATSCKNQGSTVEMAKEEGWADPRAERAAKFKGEIKTDVRDSKADWEPYLPKKAPEGAPNILFVLYDDTGLASWSPYGGSINMPTLQKLADNGLTYTQWHTTALCSPTRSTLLTGRNSQWFSRCPRPYPRANGHHRPGPPGQWLEHFLDWQKPQRARTGRRFRRQQEAVAYPDGLRSLLRLHRWGNQPVVP